MVLAKDKGLSRNKSHKRQETHYDTELYDMATKNLDRQRAMANRDSGFPPLSHNHVLHARNGSQRQDIEQNDSASERLVISRGRLGKRNRSTKLSSRLAIGLEADEAANLPQREENINHDVAEQTGNNTMDGGLSHLAGNGIGSTNVEGRLGKRKRSTKLSSRLAIGLQEDEAANLPQREENINHDVAEQTGNNTVDGGLSHSVGNGIGSTNAEATSKTNERGSRGKYKSYIVDMKIKGNGSKLMVEIPDEIDRAIGENARHLVNECGRVVRTRAPLNVKNWQEAFANAGDCMWKEIQDKFHIAESSRHLKLYAFVVETMQRLYRLWKTRLHYYYKSAKCGKTDEERIKNPPPDLPQEEWVHCVKRFGSPEFKAISERNSKNRLSEKRCIHTTGNLSFAEVEDALTKENNNMKPSADVVWLVEHTTKDSEGNLQWADPNRSKEIHGKLKDVVAASGDSMTQEQVLIDVLGARSGYIRGKGTALHGYRKGIKQLAQQKIVEQQQEQLKEQKQKIQDLEKIVEEQQRSMDAFKQEMLEALATRRV